MRLIVSGNRVDGEPADIVEYLAKRAESFGPRPYVRPQFASNPDERANRYMATVAFRVLVNKGRVVRTDTAEHFIDDLCEVKVAKRLD
jgi:hypothetical protein